MVPHGNCSCGGKYMGRINGVAVCDRNCGNPEGPRRRRNRAEAEACRAESAAREARGRAMWA
eukprot:14852674-Alexandrium_andersonii.AAC.1